MQRQDKVYRTFLPARSLVRPLHVLVTLRMMMGIAALGIVMAGPLAATPQQEASAQQTPARPDTVAEKVIAPAVLDSIGLAHSSWIYHIDRQILLGVYDQDARLFEGIMTTADQSAYPVYWGAIPAAWGLALTSGGSYPEAYRLTIAEVLGAGSSFLLKRTFGRIRPFIILKRVESRSHWLSRTVVLTEKRYSFPSGHATSAFALATSLSLSFPEWYVVGPSMAWAAAVATSRLWLGVHYPSDVVAGALLGTAVALGVHLLRDAITPSFLENGEAGSAPARATAPMLRLRLPLR